MAAALLGLTGCPVEITCEDVGCAFNEVCDTTTGRCAVPARDCRINPALCRTGQLCEQSTGQCRSAQVSCTGGQACPLGQTCDASTGVCITQNACPATPCRDGAVCDLSTGRCTLRACQTSAECGFGLACDAEQDGVCVPGCTLDSPCREGSFCRPRADRPYGECLSACSLDTDCAFGSACDFTRQPPFCEPEPPCQRDADCRTDELCRDFQCGRPPCGADLDCDQGALCDTVTGVCMGGDCQEDAFSPNHTPQQAASLAQGALVRLRRCPGRPDWYTLALRRGEWMQAQLAATGSARVQVYLYDSQLRLLRADEQRATLALLDYQSPIAQDLYLRVDAARLSEASYDLSITRRQAGVCQDDSFEPNASPEQATPLTLASGEALTLALQMCRDDEDWLALRADDPEGQLRVALESDAGNATPQVEALFASGERFRITTERALELWRVDNSAPILLRATSREGRDAPYQLRMSALGPWACPSAGAHTSHTTALAIAPQSLSTHDLCPLQDAWEADWFALTPAPSEGVITITVARPSGDDPALVSPRALSVALLEGQPEGEPPRLLRVASRAPDGAWRMAAQVRPDQQLYLRVLSETAPGRIWQRPRYQVLYQYR